jgi:hypothetical protein
MEKRRITNFKKITSGNEELIAVPVKELVKVEKALALLDSRLAEGKTCCDFCCDWCDFSLDMDIEMRTR